MIDVLFEQRVIQNTGLASEAIWQAVHEAYTTNGKAEGVPLPLAFLILPLTFHEQTAKILAAKRLSGAIFKALSEEREIVVGLQLSWSCKSGQYLSGP